MIVKMERLSAFGMIEDKDDILNRLIRKSCVHFIDPEEALDELAISAKTGEPKTAAYNEALERFASALDKMKPYAAKKNIFQKRPQVKYDELEVFIDEAEALCVRIETLKERVSDLSVAREAAAVCKETLVPWVSSAVPLEIRSTDSLDIAYYSLPADVDKMDLFEALEANAPASYIEYALEDKEQKLAVVVNHKEYSDITWEILESFNAIAVHFNAALTGPPKKNIADLEVKLLEYDDEIGRATNELKELGKDLSTLRFGYDALALKILREEAAKSLTLTKTAFGFSAWVPETRKSEIEEILNEFNCEYKFKAASQRRGDDPPILFKNNFIGQASEAVVQMYSLPSYYSSDPNYVVAPFFSLFFGMMLADAAYGIILFLGGLFVIKRTDFSDGVKGICKALMGGGVSAVIWGAIYGSWFGDIVAIVAKTFFNSDFSMPSLINPLEDPITVLVLSLGFGVAHIIAGMGVKAYLLIKRGRVLDAVFDIGIWYVVMLGIGVIFFGGAFSPAGKYITMFGAIGLILTQGRSKKRPVPKLVGGVASLYDIIGYFSDMLSYSRILAMGLSSAVIASVFNTIGSMLGGGIFGAILLLVVFLFGHAFNIILSSFGSYVHTARLQYVEFFGKFYESGGKPFQPFRAVTKFCRLEE